MGIGVLSAPSVGQAKEVARYIDDGVDDAIGNLGKKVNPPALPQADAGSATRLPEPLKLTKGLEGNTTGAKVSSSMVSMDEELFSQSLTGFEKIGAYKIYGNKGLIGDTFNRNIFLIETNTKGLSGFNSLIKNMEAEAISAGARKISIYGSSVINNGFLNSNTASRFGYSFERIGNGVILQKVLRP